MEGNVFEGRERSYSRQLRRSGLPPLAQTGQQLQYRGTVADWKVNRSSDLGADAPQTQSAAESRRTDLRAGGRVSAPRRVDKRVIDNVHRLKGRVIDSQEEVGGWARASERAGALDSDHDGMLGRVGKRPRFEPKRSDRPQCGPDGDGYTNLGSTSTAFVGVLTPKSEFSKHLWSPFPGESLATCRGKWDFLQRLAFQTLNSVLNEGFLAVFVCSERDESSCVRGILYSRSVFVASGDGSVRSWGSIASFTAGPGCGSDFKRGGH